ncbi:MULTISPECIES: hypothetical protein [unclassified Lactococcus]|nr:MULTISPECIES: hypothetical protein [unclassified Lactococcus]
MNNIEWLFFDLGYTLVIKKEYELPFSSLKKTIFLSALTVFIIKWL